jgi:hypothetical protein
MCPDDYIATGSTVTYLYGDHLGSTSLTTDWYGQQTGQQTYYPYGAVRTGSLPTDYTFTGQRVDASASLMYYGARYYDRDYPVHRAPQYWRW